jgi:hypothetical protein
MSSPETAGATKPSLAQDWLSALRYWLRGWRGLIIFVAVIGLAAIGLSWSWLVAVGIAPLLLAFAPCAAMCAVGLCASRMGGGSCASKTGAADEGASQAARAEALPAAAPDPNQLTLELNDSSTAARPGLTAPAAPERATDTKTAQEEKIHAPRKLKTVVAASALIGGLLAAPALYAHGPGGGGMMGGMMQGRQVHVMDHDGRMESMMNMMSQMSSMMEHRNKMMQGTGGHESGAQRPNEQWGDRQSAPQDHSWPQAPDR